MRSIQEKQEERPVMPAPIQAGERIDVHMAQWDKHFRELSQYLIALHAGPHAREIADLKARIAKLEARDRPAVF